MGQKKKRRYSINIKRRCRKFGWDGNRFFIRPSLQYFIWIFFPSFLPGLLTRRKWSAGLHPTFWHMEVEEREFITIVYASSSRCAKWAPVRFLSPLSHAHQRRTLLLLLGRRSKSRPRSIVSFFCVVPAAAWQNRPAPPLLSHRFLLKM